MSRLPSESLPRVDGKKHGEREPIKLERVYPAPPVFSADKEVADRRRRGGRVLPKRVPE